MAGDEESAAHGPEDAQSNDPEAAGLTRNPRPTTRGTASYQRRRAVKACQVCRARRTKCDNLKPTCSFCLKVGATCIQSPTDLSSFDQASLKILERLDDLEELMKAMRLEAADATAGELPHHKNKTRVVVQEDFEPGNTKQPEADVPVPVPVAASRHDNDDDRDAPSALNSVDVSLELCMVSTIDTHDVVTWPCFDHLQPSTATPAHPAVSPDWHSVQLDKQSPHTASGLGAVDLEPLLVKVFLDNFFSYVHVKNPIFNEAETRRLVQTTILDGLDWSPASCLSLLIFALGSIARPFGPSHDTKPGTPAYASAWSLFATAQKRLGALLVSDDLIAAQCLFLSGVFMMCTFQPRKAWRFFLQALAHCQHLEFLHASLAEDDPQGRHDPYSLDQAVYWSAWKSERELREDLPLPDFNTGDRSANMHPPFFPRPPAPRDPESPFDPDGYRETTAWYFYLSEISLRRLAASISDAVRAMHKRHATRLSFLKDAASALPSYDAQVQCWSDSLPSQLSFYEPAADDDVCRFVLRGHAINFYEVIYWPFLAAHLDRRAVHCEAIAEHDHLAQKALDYHALRVVINKPGFVHRHHGTGPLIHSCSRSALILLAARMHLRTCWGLGSACGLAMPSGWAEHVRDVIDLLEYWNSETCDFEDIRRLLSLGMSEFEGPTSNMTGLQDGLSVL